MSMTKRISGVHSRRLIGRALAWLQARGWSTGETKLPTPDGSHGWKIEATDRNGQSIIVSASTQSGVWDLACRKVGQLSLERCGAYSSDCSRPMQD